MAFSERLVLMALTFLLTQGKVGHILPLPDAQDPSVHLTQDQAHNFGLGLQALAKQAHVTFVAEGSPLRPTVPDKTVLPLPAGEIPLSQAVEKLASIYDYDAQRQGQTFRLTKRYTDPQDLPGVTLEECLGSLEDVERVAERFNPHLLAAQFGTRNSAIGELVSSLSWQQLRAMQNTASDKALPIASLDPQQQQIVWKIALYFYVQRPVGSVSDALWLIKQAATPASKVAFRWSDFNNMRAFGYELPSKTQGRLSFTPLNSPNNQIGYNGPFIITRIIRRPIRNPTGTQQTSIDPTDPLLTVLSPNRVQTNEAHSEEPAFINVTLQTIVTTLNARATKETMAVDAALKSKPVTVVGQANVTPDEVMQAIAAVYGLRVKTQVDGTKLLTRRLFQITTDISGLPEAIRRVLPTPFLHALHTDDSNELADQYALYVARAYQAQSGQAADGPDSRARNDANLTALSKIQEEQRKQEKRMQVLLPSMRNAAVRQLRTHIEPELKTSPDERVSLASLSDADKQAFAAVLLAQYLGSLRPLLSRRIPEYIADFDGIYLTGGLEADGQGKQHLALFLSPPTSDGKQTFEQIGMGIPLSFSLHSASDR